MTEGFPYYSYGIVVIHFKSSFIFWTWRNKEKRKEHFTLQVFSENCCIVIAAFLLKVYITDFDFVLIFLGKI